MGWLLFAGSFVDDLADFLGGSLTFLFVKGEPDAGRDENRNAEGNSEKCRSIVHGSRPFIAADAQRRADTTRTAKYDPGS